MGTVTRMELRKIDELHPYEHNAKLHPPEQIEQLRRSFREFGMIVPVGIDDQDRVVYGHGRILAAKAEGWTEVPTVTITDLSEEQRKAFVHADNLLSETGYDTEILRSEAQALQAAGFDVSLVGFDAAGIQLAGIEAEHFWDQEAEDSEEYQEFLDKFTPAKTSDDCYTPANIYAAVKAWALKRYSLEAAEVIRPFYPGGDYQKAAYPEGSVVIDNPPFSILSEICKWYQEHSVRFFLFAPGTSLFSIASGEAHYLPIGVGIIYENKATISTSFVTNLGDYRIEIAPDLYQAVNEANDENLRAMATELPHYDYPDCVAVSARMNKLARYGEDLRIREADALFTRAMDAQREVDKAIFGGGFFLSASAAAEKAAAEKAAAEKAAATRWQLSDRERVLIANLGTVAPHG